jgi:seryl-tRNA synthetase
MISSPNLLTEKLKTFPKNDGSGSPACDVCLQIPNLPQESVPIGKDEKKM